MPGFPVLNGYGLLENNKNMENITVNISVWANDEKGNRVSLQPAESSPTLDQAIKFLIDIQNKYVPQI